MKHKIILTVLLMYILIAGACAQPENIVPETKTPETAADNGVVSEKQSSMPADLHSDHLRQISETYGSGDNILIIDAQAYIPSSDPQSGTLKVKNMDLALIGQYLCDNEQLQEKPSGDNSTLYVNGSHTIDNSLDYDISYQVSGDIAGNAAFSNYLLDKYFVGTDAQYRDDKAFNSEDQDYVRSMADKASKTFENIGLACEPSKISLYVGTDNRYCSVWMDAFVDGYPLVSRDDFMYTASSLFISEHGINGIQFSGLFDIENANQVSILSLDEALAVIKSNVEEKTINTSADKLLRIRLAYMVVNKDGVRSFYPVWCFDGYMAGLSEGEGARLAPLVCINAQTGAIEFAF